MAALRSIAPASLPPAPLARGTAEVAGKTLAIRSLTRGEQLQLNAIKEGPNPDAEGEVFLLACGLDLPIEEAKAWWDESDGIVVGNLVRDIATLSRIIGRDGPSPLAPKKSRSASSSKAT